MNEAKSLPPNLPADFQIQGVEELARLRPSPTNPRKRFPKDEIAALAESFGLSGVLCPLLVRPVSAIGSKPATFAKGKWSNLDHFEVVDGERRYRAAGEAGLAQVPVIVRNLTDDQVRIAQLVSFAQRADLLASEEAAAYRDLAAAGKTAEQIAAEVGKPLGFVRSFLRLGKLPGWALDAVDRGVLPRATAELAARVPGEASREKAVACVLTGDMWPASVKIEDAKKAEGGKVLSYRDTRSLIHESFTRELKTAPFDRKSLTLVDAAGSCEACPSRAGNDPEATADGVRADTCMNPDCFREKETAYRGQVAEACAKKGIQPADLDSEGFDRPPRGWCRTDEPVSNTDLSGDFTGYQGWTLAQKLKEKGVELPQKYFAWGKGGKVVYLVKTSEARKALIEAKVLKKKPTERKVATATDEAPMNPAGVIARWQIDERAAAIAGRILGEYAGEQCAALVELDDAKANGPICDALRFVARSVLRDCMHDDREEAAAAAFGVTEAEKEGWSARQSRAGAEADKKLAGMTAAELLGVCLRLSALSVLAERGDRDQSLAEELLGWAELDWPQLKEQAERELKTGVTIPTCRICQCTEADCSGCVARTGSPCTWCSETKELCTACLPIIETDISILFVGLHALADKGRMTRLTNAGIRCIGHVLNIGPTPKGLKMADVGELKAAAQAFIDRQLESIKSTPKPATKLAVGTLEHGVWIACHSFAGAEERWEKLRSRGATNAEIRVQLEYELGECGGSSGTGYSVSYKKSGLKLWAESAHHAGKPTLAGAALVGKVREVLGIPLKAKVPA